MRLAIGGVPLHPALVHFPVAFWMAAPVVDLAALAGAASLWPVSWWLVAAGLAMAVPAALAGFLDALSTRLELAAEATLWRHAGWMMLASTAFALALVAVPANPLDGLQRLTALALHGAGAAALIAGGHLGGRLVHVHRLPSAPAAARGDPGA